MTLDYGPLEARFGDRLLHDEPLARHTAARLGGPADVLITAKTLDEFLFAVHFAWERGVPYRILGGGANVLAADAGFRGLIVVNRADALAFEADGCVRVESGLSLSTLARRCMARGLDGLQWAVSVPGTLGGAVINNAGAHGSDMAACLVETTVHYAERVATLTLTDMAYGYRASALKHGDRPFAVTEAVLQLQPGGDPVALRAEADGYVAHRKRTQPPGASLGSIFKNPPGDYAGRLIEAAGLKGARIGGVQISPVHANFFVHAGAGTSADYVALIRLAQETVAVRFGVHLELEIQLI